MDPSIGRNRGHGGAYVVVPHNQPRLLKNVLPQGYTVRLSGEGLQAGTPRESTIRGSIILIHILGVQGSKAVFFYLECFVNTTLQTSWCTLCVMWNSQMEYVYFVC